MLCTLDAKDWLNVILAIIGILVSSIGLIIAIRQIIGVKKTSEAVQKEVLSSQNKIRQTVESNEIGKAIKDLEFAIEDVKRREFTSASLKMMDVQVLLENDELISKFLDDDESSKYIKNKRRFNNSIKTVNKDINFIDNIDITKVKNSLVDIRKSLIQVENAIKHSAYDRES